MTATDDREPEGYDEEVPRSLFSSLWFRALVVVLALGVVAAIAVPYILDVVSTPPPAAVKAPPAPPVAAVVPAPPPPAPSAPSTEAAPGAGAPEPPSAAGGPPEPAPPAPPPAAAVRPQESGPAAPGPRGADAPRARTLAKAAPTKESGPYWVQVGAFRDPAAARRLAERLRAENYKVTESVTAPPRRAAEPTDRYHVVISGASPSDVEARLSRKGLRGERVDGGIQVSPGLPLREAVALSKELAAEGLQVQVRRAAGAATGGAAPEQGPLHRVRVGAFSDRQAALAVMKDLEAKGYHVFLARGDR